MGIKSTDNGNPPLSFTKYITVQIEDVNEAPTSIVVKISLTFLFDFDFDLIGTYAYYLRKVWVYALSAEGPLNSTRLI